ncbi:hypothetical protein IC235_11825 [Hymenobacter sp. BT664]|uniref:Integrase catalytic domain-containing protein n=1 Tax=Hymenobacter montanus TaxID=2771359 RepID=A0A927BD26_9BACT|nr:hypothetical protein [Hymenobacter montanus]MBD2768575.1 hypothetical protein [Hymenobacter montanus]
MRSGAGCGGRTVGRRPEARQARPLLSSLVAAEFRRRVLETLPYQVQTVLSDNGVPFSPRAPQFPPGGHCVDCICCEYGVAHRLTTPAHPWINSQVERRNRTSKEATSAFITRTQTSSYGVKALGGLTPYELVCAQWQRNPTIFTRDPTRLIPGLYSQASPL